MTITWTELLIHDNDVQQKWLMQYVTRITVFVEREQSISFLLQRTEMHVVKTDGSMQNRISNNLRPNVFEFTFKSEQNF